MAEISKITLPSGTTYDIKDATARAAIAGGTSFLGITTTALTDGATTATIVIDGQSVSAVNGGIAIYNNGEFIYSSSDSKWHEIGDTTNLGDLAWKDSASGSYKPAGTVSAPTFSGTESNVTITTASNENGNYQPSGTVSKPTFSGSMSAFTGKFTPDGTVTVMTKSSVNKTATVSPASSGEVTYTPNGNVSAPTFTGTQATINSSATYKPKGNISLTSKTASVTFDIDTTDVPTSEQNYKPDGVVSSPTISVKTAGTTTTIKNPTSVNVAKTVVAAAPGATAPANAVTYYNVTGETLSLYQLGYTTGASITTSNVTVKTGDAAYQAGTIQFAGIGVKIGGSYKEATGANFNGTEETISSSATYKPAGTNSAPSFSGTGVRLVTGNIPVPNEYTAAFSGTEGTVAVAGTPNGSVTQPTFTGDKVQISGTTTAEGTVSAPTFSGTNATITVS